MKRFALVLLSFILVLSLSGSVSLACSSDSDCQWCGTSCIERSENLICPMVMPPKDYECECIGGRCASVLVPTNQSEAIIRCSNAGFEVISVDSINNKVVVIHHGFDLRIYPIIATVDGTVVRLTGWSTPQPSSIAANQTSTFNLVIGGNTTIRVTALCEYGNVNVSVEAVCRGSETCWYPPYYPPTTTIPSPTPTYPPTTTTYPIAPPLNKTKLLQVLENMKTRLEELKTVVQAIVDYYSGIGDTSKATCWKEVILLFEANILKIENIIAEIEIGADLEKIRYMIGDLRNSINVLINKIFECSAPITTLPTTTTLPGWHAPSTTIVATTLPPGGGFATTTTLVETPTTTLPPGGFATGTTIT